MNTQLDSDLVADSELDFFPVLENEQATRISFSEVINSVTILCQDELDTASVSHNIKSYKS